MVKPAQDKRRIPRDRRAPYASVRTIHAPPVTMNAVSNPDRQTSRPQSAASASAGRVKKNSADAITSMSPRSPVDDMPARIAATNAMATAPLRASAVMTSVRLKRMCSPTQPVQRNASGSRSRTRYFHTPITNAIGISRPTANSNDAAIVIHGPAGDTTRSNGTIRMVSTPPAS